MNKIIVIYSGPYSNSSARVSKLLKLLESNNFEYELWCWEREPECSNTHKNIKILLYGGGENNRKLVFYYFWWFWRVFKKIRKVKRTKIYCIGLIAAVPVIIINSICKNEILFDNNDNFSKSYKFPQMVKKLLEKIETIVATKAKIHIIPGKERWPVENKNIKIVKNSPLKNTIINAEKISKKLKYSLPEILTIYINGWLTETRGINIIIETLEEIKNTDIHIIIAGKILTPQAKKLTMMKNVEYLGIVDQEISLAQYYRCNLAITLYDPSIEINRLAEPNKWMDCIITNTPFIVNEGIETAKPFIETRSCFTINYNDKYTFIQLLKRLIKNPHELEIAKKNLKQFHVDYWDDSMQQILSEWIK